MEQLSDNLDERVKQVLAMPDLETKILNHINCGGALIDFSELWRVPLHVLNNFMNETNERQKLFVQAAENRAEFARQKILREIERLAHSDIRKLYNEDGTLKPVHLWPADVAASVAGLDVEELIERDEQGNAISVGQIKKLKREPKIQALKMLAVQVEQLKPRPIEVTGKLSLEDLVGASWEDEDNPEYQQPEEQQQDGREDSSEG